MIAVGMAAMLTLSGCGPVSPAQAQAPGKSGSDAPAKPKDGEGKPANDSKASKADKPKAHPTVSTTTTEDQRKLPKLAATNVYEELVFHKPLWVGTAPDKLGRLFVVEQSGKIKVFKDDASAKPESVKTFLDLSAKVYMGHNEEGLLALAFHPKFKDNGHCYVYYSLKGEGMQTVLGRDVQLRYGILSRFTVDKKDPDKIAADSEVELMRITQPWGNHNGADLLFGKDGYLYFSLGDGGAGGDPLNSGQDLSTLLGTILRIDIDKQDKGKKYAVPKDNPFVGKTGAQPEIWAYGLRNVWRMCFDTKTDELWAGDVGQNAWEEIDLIVKGGNYGWRIREGAHKFGRGTEEAPDLIDPVVEYAQSRADGRSVTGGVMHRGTSIKGLDGVYVFGDYESGRVWGVTRGDDGKVTEYSILCDTKRRISSFGYNTRGELLFCNHLTNGRLVKLDLAPAVPVEE